jgi:hypothetical protein
MVITPVMAKEYLKANIGNRPLRRGHVKDLADAITRGEFLKTHQGIAFDTGGNVLDGQHRLEAIVAANMPVAMNVTFDAPSESFAVLDQGTRRTASDILRIQPRQAEVVRLAARVLSGSSRVTPKELERMNAAIGDTAAELIARCGACNKFFSAAPMKLAAVARVLGGADREYVFQLYYDLVHYNLDVLPPIGHSIIKQVGRNMIDSGDTKMKLARGFLVFNPDSRETTRVQVKDPDVSYDMVKNVLWAAVRRVKEGA